MMQLSAVHLRSPAPDPFSGLLPALHAILTTLEIWFSDRSSAEATQQKATE